MKRGVSEKACWPSGEKEEKAPRQKTQAGVGRKWAGQAQAGRRASGGGERHYMCRLTPVAEISGERRENALLGRKENLWSVPVTGGSDLLMEGKLPSSHSVFLKRGGLGIARRKEGKEGKADGGRRKSIFKLGWRQSPIVSGDGGRPHLGYQKPGQAGEKVPPSQLLYVFIPLQASSPAGEGRKVVTLIGCRIPSVKKKTGKLTIRGNMLLMTA